MVPNRIHASIFENLADAASRSAVSSIAIVDSSSRLTYEDLLRRSAMFCDELARAAVHPGDRVATVLANGAPFLISAFGTWKRGAILVPLSPQLRESEFPKYLSECSARTVVTDLANERIVQKLKETEVPIQHTWLCEPGGRAWSYRKAIETRKIVGENEAGSVTTGPQHPAIFQYSTGTTGWPKRITRTHGQVMQEYRAKLAVLGMTGADRILGVAPFFHSHGLMNCAMLALLSGSVLYCPNAFFPREIARLIERERITGFPGTPYMFQLLADLKELCDFSSLRFALTGGAPLTASTASAFERVYKIPLRQHYGSTETGLITICDERTNRVDVRSVGYPLPGVTVEIVDELGNCLPAKTVGHVKIKSEFAATRYDNFSGSSESHFEGDAFFPGDLGQMEADGELILCGRSRGFINVGGNKVDPSEVEAVLVELPGVREALVFGVPDGAAGEKVKAVVVASQPIPQAVIRAHCAKRLAPFKQPKIVEFLNELPRSPLGKVLRKYLMDEALPTERPPS